VAVAPDTKLSRFTDAADDQGERFAPEDVYGISRIEAVCNQRAAKRQNRRRAGDTNVFGKNSIAAGEHGSDRVALCKLMAIC
jgi:hypothetical protein